MARIGDDITCWEVVYPLHAGPLDPSYACRALAWVTFNACSLSPIPCVTDTIEACVGARAGELALCPNPPADARTSMVEDFAACAGREPPG